MSTELLATIIGFITLLISLLGVFIQLNVRMDKLSDKQDSNFKTLLNRIDKVQSELQLRIDNINTRLDNLYHELFRKAA